MYETVQQGVLVLEADCEVLDIVNMRSAIVPFHAASSIHYQFSTDIGGHVYC